LRGYFGIGIEGVSKPMNAGALFRTAHAFGASFVFTVAADYARRQGRLADTSDTPGHVPFYAFPDADSLLLPKGCVLVGVERTEGATPLPSFRHPKQAAYVLGSERGSLSPALTRRCRFVVRIPTAFSLNIAVAGAVVMYDRVKSFGRFPRRPEWPGGKPEPPAAHVFGDPLWPEGLEAFRSPPPPADDPSRAKRR
jgi:tRNA G18 (ribose-2'-O)-methylase SpoU